jgi:4-amino-4-deoxy-L-arabinose transferase-like glycosyltransferase
MAAHAQPAALAKQPPSALTRALAGLRAQPLLLALIGCYLALGCVASVLIPPWQSPDEPAHFEYARNVAVGASGETPAVQQPIIASFYRYRFWDFRGVDVPETAPASFTALNRLIIRQTDKTPFYYWMAAAASSWTDDVTLQLYSMRWLSVLLSALTIPLAYLIARETLPEARSALALVAAAVVAFLPMYAYIGASVNPDTVGAPLGAATIWLAARGLRGKQPAWMVAGALLCALLAFWGRRSSIALIPWALLLAAAWAFGYAARRLPRAVVLAAGLIVALAVAGALAWPSEQAAAWNVFGPQQGPTRSAQVAFAGAHSLRLAGQAQQQPIQLVQPFTPAQLRLLAKQSVIIQAVVRSGAGQVSGRLLLSVAPSVGSRDKLRIEQTPVENTVVPFVASPEWRPIELRATMPAVAQWSNLLVELDGDGELYVDQVQLLDAATRAQPVVLSNAGGEDVLLWWQQRYWNNQVVQYLTRILRSARDGVYVSQAAFELYPYFLGQMFDSLIGRFGWMSIFLNRALIYAIGGIWLALLAALAGVWRRGGEFDPARRRVVIWLLLAIAFTIGSIFLEYTSYLFARTYPQGRYLFPVLAAIAALLAVGLAQVLPARHDRAAVAVVIVALIALDIWSWVGVIVPYFYG